MFRILIALAIFACVTTSCGTSNVSLEQLDVNRAVSAVDATNAWNSVCASYNFIPKPADTRITFFMGYYGGNFNADFAAIKAHVSQILTSPSGGSTGSDVMSSPSGGSTGNDVMKSTIENW